MSSLGSTLRDVLDMAKEWQKKKMKLADDENLRQNNETFYKQYASPYSNETAQRTAALKGIEMNNAGELARQRLISDRQSQESINKYQADIYRTDVGARTERYKTDKGGAKDNNESVVTQWMQNNPTATADQIVQFKNRLNAKPPAEGVTKPVNPTINTPATGARATLNNSLIPMKRQVADNNYDIFLNKKPSPPRPITGFSKDELDTAQTIHNKKYTVDIGGQKAYLPFTKESPYDEYRRKFKKNPL